MKNLASEYWGNRYVGNDIPWDAGSITKPIQAFADGLTDKSLKILIPGCGNAYEAEYFFRKGFVNTFILDYAPAAVENFTKRVPEFPKEQALCEDFFTHEGQYDLIIEQTFFCALLPEQRESYVKKVHQLLRPSGKLAGVLFDAPLNTDKVPYGGTKEEYLPLFKKYFDKLKLEPCKNSIKPREGSELFILAEK